MKLLLSGNEAVALGAKDAGVRFAAAYPGTPSTEVLETIAAKWPEIEAQWSVNEKVAFETGIGTSLAGARTLIAMKHVGVNVAADPLMTLAYTGVNGGFVLVSADDPNMYSSQNEQDNRHYARFAKIPMLEPSDSQEAYTLCREAFEISERFDTPVMLRITTRVAHSKTLVTPEAAKHAPEGFRFAHAREKYVMIPAYARVRHALLEKRLKRLREFSEDFSYHRIEKGNKTGFITSGVDYNYVKETFPEASILKLGMTNPLPEKMIRLFSKSVNRCYVIESLDAFLEEQIRAQGVRVSGKDRIGWCGELSVEALHRAFPPRGRKSVRKKSEDENLPPRFPVLCAGCSHRGIFYVLKKKKYIVAGDIGCYTLSVLPPLEAMDTCICMGASAGTATGLELVRRRTGASEKVVGVIGDSTFIHSGITPLLDAVYNKRDTKLIILDNFTTAMTGHQAHPATGKTIRGEETRALDFAELARGLGVEHVFTVDAYDLEAIERVLDEEFNKPGVAVLIVRRPCIQLKGVGVGEQRTRFDSERCVLCKLCLDLGCPALSLVDDQIVLDEFLCTSCGLCVQVCKPGALTLEPADSPFARV
jgi:indolepyruvate ferredoxin oxidoreductase alpha subunit